MRGKGCGGVSDLLPWARPCSVNLQFNFLLMGGAMSLLCSLPWVDLPQKDLCQQSGAPRTVVFSAHDLTTGHSQLTALPENPGHSQASVAQSLEGSRLLSSMSWYLQGFVCALQESVSPVLCKFWWLYGGVNGDLLPEDLCHARVCCTQSPCGRPLLTHTSTGDTQIQLWQRLCGVSGSWCAQGLSEPSEHLWWVWGLILNMILPLLSSFWACPLPLGVGYLFWWDSTFSCQWLFSCKL